MTTLAHASANVRTIAAAESELITPQPAASRTASIKPPDEAELRSFSRKNADAVESIKRVNPELFKLTGGEKIPILVCEDLSRVVGAPGGVKPGSALVPVRDPDTGERQLSIMLDLETPRHSSAAVAAALDFEFHKIARLKNKELYPDGMLSVLEKSIKDLEKIKNEWQKSNRGDDAAQLSEQIKCRTSALEHLRSAPIPAQPRNRTLEV